ncbi:MAG: hypothetical protein JSS76_13780 [Bacteroidetes bacterium]|nr:hypothetical protein [Bacteroidota bacterium]
MNNYTSISSLTTTARRRYLRREKAIMMVKASKFILFFYILSVFRPVVPLVSDAIAHTFYEQQHIMQVHEVNGKFHIHDEIGKSLSHGEQGDTTSVWDVPEYVHTASLTLPVRIATSVSRLYSSHSPLYASISADVVSPPPCI